MKRFGRCSASGTEGGDHDGSQRHARRRSCSGFFPEGVANEEAFPEKEEAVGRCLISDCTNTFGDHYWGRVEATNKGWFFRRGETGQWCPDHLPEWVDGWRAMRR